MQSKIARLFLFFRIGEKISFKILTKPICSILKEFPEFERATKEKFGALQVTAAQPGNIFGELDFCWKVENIFEQLNFCVVTEN